MSHYDNANLDRSLNTLPTRPGAPNPFVNHSNVSDQPNYGQNSTSNGWNGTNSYGPNK
jgi:hypothetical protein